MIQVTSPGLPPWPKLWFDPKRKRAVVVARHATWRSHEWAYHTAEVLAWGLKIGLACLIWASMPASDVIIRVMLTLIAITIGFPIVTLLTRSAFRGVLARQLFATRTVFWATPDAIIYKSRLYSSPVVIWRSWNGKPVKTRFIIQPDPDAASFIGDRQDQRKLPRGPITEAVLIETVIATPHRQGTRGGESLQRSIPVTEVCSRHAQKLSTVFAAAVLLVTEVEESRTDRQPDGIDIDAS